MFSKKGAGVKACTEIFRKFINFGERRLPLSVISYHHNHHHIFHYDNIQTIVLYPRPHIITCTLRIWLREIGFALSYGALMLKTWR